MVARYINKNTQMQIQMMALDGAGRLITDYPTTPANLWQIVDNLGASWPVIASSVSNGIITLTATSPNATGARVLDVRRGGVSQSIYGSSDIVLTEPYGGRFALDNSVIAYDMTIPDDATQYLYDASGNNRLGSKPTPSNYVRTKFTTTTPYKTAPGGQNITLGVAKVGATSADIVLSLASNDFACGKYAGISEFTDNIVYENGLPIKTMIGIFYKSLAAFPFDGLGLQYGWSKSGASGNEHMCVTITTNSEIRLDAGTSSTGHTVVTTIAGNDSNHLWDFDSGICLIAIRVMSIDSTGLATLKLNVNRISSASTYQFGTSSRTSTYSYKGISAYGSNGVTSSTGSTVTACLDFAAYSDLKSDQFISDMCTAWGL